MKLLPENPTQFDYLHAIRALAARGDMSAVPKLKEIFNLADAGMFAKKEPPAHIRLCGWRGMAGGDGCILPLGHDGGHGFRDGSGYLPNVIGDVAAACTPKKDQTASSPSHPPACSLFFDCEITPPPDNVRVVFFIMPYRVWWFGKMMYGEICMPTAPPKAKAIYWIPLPLVPESPDTDRWEITESMKVRKA